MLHSIINSTSLQFQVCMKKRQICFTYFIYILFSVNYAVYLLPFISSTLEPTLVLGTVFIFTWMVWDIIISKSNFIFVYVLGSWQWTIFSKSLNTNIFDSDIAFLKYFKLGEGKHYEFLLVFVKRLWINALVQFEFDFFLFTVFITKYNCESWSKNISFALVVIFKKMYFSKEFRTSIKRY